MKGPVGKCRYCGQEFMSRHGLKNHEATNCPQRSSGESVKDEPPRPRFRQAVRIGTGIGWLRDDG